MKIICHRGNLNGSESSLENKPEQIDRCINLGYDVEVDVRLNKNVFYIYIFTLFLLILQIYTLTREENYNEIVKWK